MDLNQITANIRLRSPWEAIDLGFVMVQEWWKSIYIPLAIFDPWNRHSTILFFARKELLDRCNNYLVVKAFVR